MRRLFVLFAVFLLAACSPETEDKGPVVLAAASLQDALSEAADAWTARGHPRPVLSFAASSALARQVEAGAPADLFISADEAWMDELAGKGALRQGTRRTLLSNHLVLVAPKDSDLAIGIAPGFALAEALGSRRLAMADPGAVPAGRYARQALQNRGAWDDVAGRIVPGENVRVALALVARKEAALGIVYATDARAEPGVRVLGIFPDVSHDPISYPLAQLVAGERPREAAAFRDFLESSQAMAIFRKHGFETGDER